MSWTPREVQAAEELIRLALSEDLGPRGDITSQCLIPVEQQARAAFRAKATGVVAGLPVVGLVLQHLDSSLRFRPLVEEGCPTSDGQVLAEVDGPLRSILAAERTALNFLQRLSGIATLTRRYVDLVRDLRVQVLDTRKTTPGWRLLEKYAVRMGGGTNHRLGLYDGILIKDNHLAGLGPDAIRLAIQRTRAAHPEAIIEVEVDTLAQLEDALAEQVHMVLLDNMDLSATRQAVARRDAIAPRTLLEASGGVRLDTIRAIAETGVDRISVGALTHSATALDISLDYLP